MSRDDLPKGIPTISLDGTTHNEDAIWWEKDEEEAGACMVAVAQKYETGGYERREMSRRYYQLWKGQLLGNSIYDSAAPRHYWEDIHPAWNVVQAGIGTAGSIIAKNRVKVTMLTFGADYELQDLAKEGELAIDGAFRRNKLYERLDPLLWLDGATTGLGILLTEPDELGDVIIERVIPDELIFSDVEAINGRPAQIFRIKWMSKYEAIQRYATKLSKGKRVVDEKKKAAILACTEYKLPISGQENHVIPLIPVYTGWKVASFRGADDGRRVVGIPGGQGGKGVTLSCRAYKWTRLPMSFFAPELAPAGLWGVGLAERLAGFQYRLHEFNHLIDEAGRLNAVGKWLNPRSAKVNKAQYDNTQGGVIDYLDGGNGGAKPEFVTYDGVPAFLLQERKETYEQALREIGLSDWTVGGEQPDNVESGEGFRQLREQEQGRALPAGQQWEAVHIDCGECVLMAFADALEQQKALKSAVAESKSKSKAGKKDDVSVSEHDANFRGYVIVHDQEGEGLRKIDYETLAKLLEDPDSTLLQAFPTSILPNTPTGKFEKLNDWLKEGRIDRATYAALSDMPDLNMEASLELAGVRSVRWAISNIVRHGRYETPDHAMPLLFAIKLATTTRLKGLRNGMPEEKLHLLDTFARDARDLLAGQAPAAPGTTPPVPGTGTPTEVPGVQPGAVGTPLDATQAATPEGAVVDPAQQPPPEGGPLPPAVDPNAQAMALPGTGVPV